MKTILVVEDESGPADGLVEVLRQEGYRPVLAREGKEGLARCDEALPDLLIVDFMMPGMNGAEMIREIRKDPARQNVPIILMSAADEPIIRRYYAGYDAFLKKPFETGDLMTLVRRLLPDPPAGA